MSGVTMARLSRLPIEQNSFSLVLNATTSWAKEQSDPGETYRKMLIIIRLQTNRLKQNSYFCSNIHARPDQVAGRVQAGPGLINSAHYIGPYRAKKF